MNDQGFPSPDRLDSWKAIADYLGRDVATVRRWERLHRLPVRRIAGRGRSVFAYVSEIDEWLRAMPPAEVAAGATSLEDAPAASPETRSPRRWLWAAAALLVASGVFWSIPLLTSESLPFRAEMTTTGIVAVDKSGRELWRYAVSPEDRRFQPPHHTEIRILAGSDPGVLAATLLRERVGDGSLRGGQLLWLTPNGDLSRAYSFDDSVSFGGVKYGEPWNIENFSVDERTGKRRIAVAARHDRWWPAIVTVFDDQWRRTGTFVNTGWVTQVKWLSSDRLLISGFSNDRDGGMVGILDVGALDGQSPPATDPEFQCGTCGPGLPIRYVVLPRSEVNLASGSSRNGAIVQVQDDRILVRTIEVRRPPYAVEALYEFTPALELVRASYGDRYWEAHRALETEGKIAHTQAQCPHRHGPDRMTAFEPATGWRTLAPDAGISPGRD